MKSRTEGGRRRLLLRVMRGLGKGIIGRGGGDVQVEAWAEEGEVQTYDQGGKEKIQAEAMQERKQI